MILPPVFIHIQDTIISCHPLNFIELSNLNNKINKYFVHVVLVAIVDGVFEPNPEEAAPRQQGYPRGARASVFTPRSRASSCSASSLSPPAKQRQVH